ncbi:GNAT family N-acetyltransferase [Amycolatopsis thermoflava]|uniref:GNAT family N-acetyltransferase n=1 Tax=Amycolatopsis thermoflava TaxID=84480 RepID=UPI0004865214|nr:GNAT family N-acetyltransferase [Amycolatopsis thermoflava]
MTFLLRAMTCGDVPTVAAVWAASWRDGHVGHVNQALERIRTPASFVARAARRVPGTVVAESGSTVVGFATVVGDELEELFVASRARGTGIATALLRDAETRIAHNGAAKAWLAVVAGNTRARRFYEREGWIDAGSLDYAAEGENGPMVVPCRRYEKGLGNGAQAHPPPRR